MAESTGTGNRNTMISWGSFGVNCLLCIFGRIIVGCPKPSSAEENQLAKLTYDEIFSYYQESCEGVMFVTEI